jgi:hypothetical protein
MSRGARGAGSRGRRDEEPQEGVMYELMGRVHAAALRERGQGTVEYVGLVLLIAALLAGVIAAGTELKGGGLADTVAKKLKDTIDNLKL